MKIAIVTDAWHPQVNGVVTTLSQTRRKLIEWDIEVAMLSPAGHPTLPCPTYPEIRLAVLPARRLAKSLRAYEPDAIHIATEGPLGIASSRFCQREGLAFTTSYHTQFPKYLAKRFPIPESWSYAFLRNHHNAGRRAMVPTQGQRRELLRKGFRDVVIWPRGVDTSVFCPRGRHHLPFARPIWVYAGRLAIEKNIEAYLSLNLPGTKVLVGEGPDKQSLAERFPHARFIGYKFGEQLAEVLSSADVFVFPSRTDTFGLVMLEAMACGTPVAAFPVIGPVDVVDDRATGVLAEDLREAALAALRLDREACRAAASRRTWDSASRVFLSHLVAARSGVDLVGRPSLPGGAAALAPAS